MRAFIIALLVGASACSKKAPPPVCSPIAAHQVSAERRARTGTAHEALKTTMTATRMFDEGARPLPELVRRWAADAELTEVRAGPKSELGADGRARVWEVSYQSKTGYEWLLCKLDFGQQKASCSILDPKLFEKARPHFRKPLPATFIDSPAFLAACGSCAPGRDAKEFIAILGDNPRHDESAVYWYGDPCSRRPDGSKSPDDLGP